MSTTMLPLRDAPLVRDETRLKEGGGIEMSTTVLSILRDCSLSFALNYLPAATKRAQHSVSCANRHKIAPAIILAFFKREVAK